MILFEEKDSTVVKRDLDLASNTYRSRLLGSIVYYVCNYVYNPGSITH